MIGSVRQPQIANKCYNQPPFANNPPPVVRQMPSLPRARARLAQWRGWLPLAILLAALASLFVLGGERAYFRREGGSHNELSVKNLAIAENLSIERGLRLATSRMAKRRRRLGI